MPAPMERGRSYTPREKIEGQGEVTPRAEGEKRVGFTPREKEKRILLTPRISQQEHAFQELLNQISVVYGKLRNENVKLRKVVYSAGLGADMLSEMGIHDKAVSRPCSASSALRSPPRPIASISASGGALEQTQVSPAHEYSMEIKKTLYNEFAQEDGIHKQHQDAVEESFSTTHMVQPRYLSDEDCQDEDGIAMNATTTMSSRTSWKESAESIDSRRKKLALQMASGIWSYGGSEQDDRWERMNGVRKLVRSHSFETFFCCVIFTNTVYIGFETDYLARNLSEEPPVWCHLINSAFLLMFLLELGLRLLVEGRSFWWSKANWAWNWLDAFVVGAAVFEAVATIIHHYAKDTIEDSISGISNIRIVRIIRLARLLRIFRISRIMRFVSALRTLVYSIIGTLLSLFWAVLLLVLIIFSFGVIFTQVAGDHRLDKAQDPSGNLSADDEALNKYYSSLPTSMFALFMSIAAGISWEEVVYPLFNVSWIWGALFTIFIAFTYFAVLNIVTANFCQSAIDSAAFDQELIIHRQAMQKKTHANLTQRLFSCIDQNGSGRMSLAELEKHFHDRDVQAYLQSLELDPHDAWSLFKLLDADQDNGIEMTEFVQGCMRMRGFAKKIDLAELIQQTQVASQQMSDFMAHVDEQFQLLHRSQLWGQSPNAFSRPVSGRSTRTG